MKTEITTDRIESEDVTRTEAEQSTEPDRKQSLNLKVRARIGVETRTQLMAGSGCDQTATRTS
jgi:hypothetical protein